MVAVIGRCVSHRGRLKIRHIVGGKSYAMGNLSSRIRVKF